MIKVGITGQIGFIGTHLYNYLSLKRDRIVLIPFQDEYFENEILLKIFVTQCDCIIHLAALNRHNDPEKIRQKNLELVDKLIYALRETNSKAHIIFSSSTQEERKNAYGRSKKEGREKLAEWSRKNGSGYTGMIIPNVFGPFGKPFYNSVIATFSYQLVNNEIPAIETDSDLKLIYINELLEIIDSKLENCLGTIEESFVVPHLYSSKVSELLTELNYFKDLYLNNGMIPSLHSSFENNLFNTFRSYIDYKNFYPVTYNLNKDERGRFVELMKFNSGGQVSFSSTKPGIARGNHFHTRKYERFAVIKGQASIRMRKYNTDEILEFRLTGDKPSFVDIPIWYTHNITNIGEEELLTIFWTNEFYNPDDPDTFYEVV